MNTRAWLEARGHAKMVTRQQADYLWRLYLWRWPELRKRDWPEAGFLHTFYMDDPDPLHCHPWDWGRIILRGEYIEHRDGGAWSRCGPGHVVRRRPAESLHRVELLTPSVTTVFWHWQRRRTWGFQYPDGWRPAPPEGQDGRPWRGRILPRKVGPAPVEIVHGGPEA